MAYQPKQVWTAITVCFGLEAKSLDPGKDAILFPSCFLEVNQLTNKSSTMADAQHMELLQGLEGFNEVSWKPVTDV